MDDRTFLVPKHAGYSTLPNTPLFSRLLRFAHRNPSRVAIEDGRSNYQRTHLELLSDLLALRETILKYLDPGQIEALDRRNEVYIAIVAGGGYEYVVAILAVLALGAVAVPLAPGLPVEEAAYCVEKSRAALVLVSSFDLERCCRLENRISSTVNERFRSILIAPCTLTPPLTPSDILVSSDRALDENGASLVIFISALRARRWVPLCDDVMLHVLPVHHATGVGINVFPVLIAGGRIEFRSEGFDEVWMWERWKEGAVNGSRQLTFFSGVPTIYMRMRRHYQRHLAELPPLELAKYLAGARQFRACLCGTSALPQPLNDFWTMLMQKRIVQRYGATEFGAVIAVHLNDKRTSEGSVGEVVSGVDLKLSEGDEGEILVKSPHMFSKYLHDPEATARAHDEDGYFRTGVIARREGKYYYIVGRASLDIIKSGGYKISALDIERELLSLPYIAEAIVVGVVDEEFSQRVAALVSLQEEELSDAFLETYGNSEYILTLEDLRRDLRHRLAGYKLPTFLRIVQKKLLSPQYFPNDYQMCAEVQQWVKASTILAKL
ncbi:acetyl-CoA synthetase-like protein [Lentithecium fluviatile CBS 122367]|uniref:Acetyl-CoA synthetase-like protein n=1 Tax=Lentithecium fluviatile CBS 122367 TaxID=1168545 RepID=A0A6G1JLE4_9PLEO|nr:acetyl-CoA synthetase-like protein [Lentithecium fluviatile CBS 122367]